MAELILVNISKAPTSVNLPSGRPLIIQPSYGIQGDHFAKYVSSGVLVPLGAIPAGFSVRGISQPLVTEGVRTNSESSTALGRGPKRPVPTSPVSKAAAVALAEKGKSTDQDSVAKDLGVKLPPSEDRLQGLTLVEWQSRIRDISDTTLAQQMRIDALRDLARFLGIDSADILSTKADLISAVRIKVRG